MNIKQIKIFTIGLAVVSLSFGSCSKWLDVRPEDDVYAEDAFRDIKGFESGLAGVYNSMTKEDMYGATLKFSFADVLAAYWTIANSESSYYQLSNFNYKDEGVEGNVASIWSSLYRSIHQVNTMIDYLPNLPENGDKNLVKGELLGLRAFLHMEVFKWFGPVIKEEGLSAKAVPYYRSAEKLPEEFLPSTEFFARVEADLNEAAVLLKNDPIVENGRDVNGNVATSNLNYSYLLNYRGARVNIYAIRGMVARMHELKGESSKAAEEANKLIEDLKTNTKSKIALIKEADLNNNYDDKDIRFSCENLFSIIKIESNNTNKEFFGESRGLVPDYDGILKSLYTAGSGSSVDYRLVQWNIAGGDFRKFTNTSTTSNNTTRRNELKLISLPEMYFMVIEANLNTNPQLSLTLLNELRLTRGLPALNFVDSDVLKTNYIDEVRREFIGEGFLFTFYKRLFHVIYRSKGNINPSLEVFKLPIPTDELTYNKTS